MARIGAALERGLVILSMYSKGPYHQLDGVPTNYVIDRSGKLAYAKAGAFDLDALNAIVIPLLRAPIPGPATPAASSASTAREQRKE